MTRSKKILLSLASVFVLAGGSYAKPFAPTRESLSHYEVPEWYHDAKVGFFYHWGPNSVPGIKFNKDISDFILKKGKYANDPIGERCPVGQWGRSMYPVASKKENKQRTCYYAHKKMFGDAKEFTYKDFIPMMSSDKFDPELMTTLLKNAGVKYVVPMAIHHDGFAMWDSKIIDQFNAAKMGPKANTTKMVIDAARNKGLKVGVSTHAARHSWYYPKTEGYDVMDPKYVQLYGRGLTKEGLPHTASVLKWKNTLFELIDTFNPDYVFVDGGTADTYCKTKNYMVQDAFREVLAYLYNSSQNNKNWSPVISFKRESLYKEEAVPDYEGGLLRDIAPYKWQTHISISGWFYRPDGGTATKSSVIFSKLLDVVSKNGNLLINLAIQPDGGIQEQEIAFLKEMEQWMNVVSEGIHATRPWLTHGEIEAGKEFEFNEITRKAIVYDDPEAIPSGRCSINKGDIRYTRSKDNKTIYASRMSMPKEKFILQSFAKNGVAKDVKIKSISLLGSKEKVNWKKTENGIEISPSQKAIFKNEEWPVMYKMETI